MSYVPVAQRESDSYTPVADRQPALAVGAPAAQPNAKVTVSPSPSSPPVSGMPAVPRPAQAAGVVPVQQPAPAADIYKPVSVRVSSPKISSPAAQPSPSAVDLPKPGGFSQFMQDLGLWAAPTNPKSLSGKDILPPPGDKAMVFGVGQNLPPQQAAKAFQTAGGSPVPLTPAQQEAERIKLISQSSTEDLLKQRYGENVITKTAGFLFAPLDPVTRDISDIKQANDVKQQVDEGKIDPSVYDGLEALHKTAPQIIGDVAQAVLVPYTLDIGGGVLADSAAQKSLQESLIQLGKIGAVQGGGAGLQFGIASALSSGSTNPDEITSIILQNTTGGAALGAVLHTFIPAVAKVVSEVNASKQQLVQSLIEKGYTKEEAMQLASHGGYIGGIPEKKSTGINPEEFDLGAERAKNLEQGLKADTSVPDEMRLQNAISALKSQLTGDPVRDAETRVKIRGLQNQLDKFSEPAAIPEPQMLSKEELTAKATQDWKDNFLQRYNDLADRAGQLEQQIKQAGSETRKGILQGSLQDVLEEQNKLTGQFAEKWQQGVPENVGEVLSKDDAKLADVKNEIAHTLQADVAADPDLAAKAPTIKQAYQDWVNYRSASRLQGFLEGKKAAAAFKEIDGMGLDGFFAYQSGDRSGQFAQINKYFEDKFNELNAAGVDVPHKEDYLPQIWNNTDKEIEQAYRRLGLKPGFSLHAIFENYQEGLSAGLSPKFDKVSDLISWYEQRADKAIADRKFFNTLVQNDIIKTPRFAPRDWNTLDPDHFPIKSTGDYAGVFKAPPEVADLINNYLRQPSGLVNTTANVASTLKNIVLSSGIPNTGLNMHGLNILTRNALASDNPLSGFLRGTYYLINPSAAERAFEDMSDRAVFFAQHGMQVSSEGHELAHIFNEASDSKIASGLGKYSDTLRKAFAGPLFEKIVPALKTQYAESIFKQLTRGGMEQDAAARLAAQTSNNMFGGINWLETGRSRQTQDLFRALILAPDFQESNINIAKGIAKGAIHFTDPQFQAYRTFSRNFLAAYIAANVANYALSGHTMPENESGHTFEIAVGQTAEGRTRYFRPFGTAVDFLRIPYDVALSISKGDLSAVGRVVRNRVSVPAQAAAQVFFNIDPFGNPIVGPDKYGNPRPVGKQIENEAAATAALVLPGAGQAALNAVTGRGEAETNIAAGAGLPLRYGSAPVQTGKLHRVSGASGAGKLKRVKLK